MLSFKLLTMSALRLVNFYHLTVCLLLHVFIQYSYSVIFAQMTTSHVEVDRQVQLQAPSNVTIFFTNSSSITIGWDAPLVYVTHFNETIFENDNATYSDDNATYSDVDNSSSVIGNDTKSTSGNSSESVLSNVPVSVVNCLPYNTLKTLANGTLEDEKVEVTSNSNTDLNNSDVNAVPYRQGCVLKYIVKWKEVDITNTAMNQLEVPATQTVANISGLKTKTNYSISVSAVFRTKDLESSSVFVSTSANEESKICHCDIFGSITVNCSQTRNTCSCKPGYYGQYCEMCAPGFYRTIHFHPCHRCPCHPPSSLISTCSIVEGFLRCDKCQLGYTGILCHQCDTGFYRYGKMCIPCRCNANAMKNSTNMCHPITGSCNKCQYNTTGFHCERCQEGYIGDPISAKNCTLKKDLNWTFQNNNVSSTSVVGIILGVIILVAFIVAVVILVRRYRFKDRRWAFWSVEMKRDDMSQLDDENDLTFYGTKTKTSTKYMKLHEDI